MKRGHPRNNNYKDYDYFCYLKKYAKLNKIMISFYLYEIKNV